MFEKEAEEYADKVNLKDMADNPRETFEKACREMAEYGYNKAKEEDKWHYVKDGDLPEERKDVLIQYTWGEFDVKHLEWNKEWRGNGTYCGLTGVIAWKEIVPPKEIKEK